MSFSSSFSLSIFCNCTLLLFRIAHIRTILRLQTRRTRRSTPVAPCEVDVSDTRAFVVAYDTATSTRSSTPRWSAFTQTHIVDAKSRLRVYREIDKRDVDARNDPGQIEVVHTLFCAFVDALDSVMSTLNPTSNVDATLICDADAPNSISNVDFRLILGWQSGILVWLERELLHCRGSIGRLQCRGVLCVAGNRWDTV